jgi:hypothetical protein
MVTEGRIPDRVGEAFGFALDEFACSPLGRGLINATYLLERHRGGERLVLQQLNTDVFRHPEHIAHNNRLAAEHLRRHHPDYLFLRPIPMASGEDLFTDPVLGVWRLYPYVAESYSDEGPATPALAFSAARQFGRLVRHLHGADVSAFRPVIADFHNLRLRFSQYRQALDRADAGRVEGVRRAMELVHEQAAIVQEFDGVMADPEVPTRIVHYDTKLWWIWTR